MCLAKIAILLVALLSGCCGTDPAAGSRTVLSLEDHRSVEQWFALYADVVDHRKFDEYADLFSSDAVVDYSASGGSSGTVSEMQSFLETSFTFLASQHLVSNVIAEEVHGKDERRMFKAQAMFHNPMVLRVLGDIYSPFFVCGGWYHVTLSVADDGSGRLVCTGLSQEMLYNTVVRECVLLLGLLGGLGFYVLRSTLCSTTKSKQH